MTFHGESLDSVAHPLMVTTAVITSLIPESNPPEYDVTEEKHYTVEMAMLNLKQ